MNKKINEILLTLFVYYITLLLGWEIITFLRIYVSMDDLIITKRLETYFEIQPYLIGIGLTLVIVIGLWGRFSKKERINDFAQLSLRLKILFGFLILLTFNLVLFKLDAHFNVLELIIFFVSLWLLQDLGSHLYKSGKVGWYHPTTHGSIIIAALLIGISLMDIFKIINLQEKWAVYFILILLLFELIILYARFQHLSKYSLETNRLARNLMGSQILFFGTRIIVGIFMPLIFIVYSTFLSEKPVEGIAALILLGTFLDRYLFIITGSDIQR